MRVLFVASEVVPFSKTGGLADVAAALPKALAARGHEVLVVSPLYRTVDRRRHGLAPTGARAFGAPLHVKELSPRLSVAFVEHGPFFDRPGIYGEGAVDYPDCAERFAFFARAAIDAPRALGLPPPDVVHLNDWQTGVAALELSRRRGLRPGVVRSVFTIHNMGYQGRFPRSVVESCELGWDAFTPEGVEFYGEVNYLKAGIAFSDWVTTVSPTYAKEIQTPEQGFGLEGMLETRGDQLVGILNGVDLDEWNPSADPLLPARFAREELAGKARCRQVLCDQLGLMPPAGTMLVGMVGRLAEQKGVDLVLAAIDELLRRPVGLAVLGSGEPRLEDGMRDAASRYPGRIAVRVGFDNGLAHRIEAGVDAFLMPSQYEPCGLNQMYSLLYGAVPIVRRTGGLADTVSEGPEGTGFLIDEHTPGALLAAVDRAGAAFGDRERWRGMMRRGMALDLSWDRSARAYEEVYRRALARG